MSWICILDGKQVFYGEISHAINSLDRTFQKDKDYFPWEHPERYIEIKKFIYAYGGKHPSKELFIQMEDEGFKIFYRSNVKKQKRILTQNDNRKYYNKQTRYVDEDGENKLFYLEKCCDLLELYMQLITKKSIDRKDKKNEHTQYPSIYTENELRLNKGAENAFNKCFESWGLLDTMEDYVKDPYEKFLPLGDVIVDDLTDALRKEYKKQRRLQNKRKRKEAQQQMNIDLERRMQKYKEEAQELDNQKMLRNPNSNPVLVPKSDLDRNHTFVHQNLNINNDNNFEYKEEFNAGF